MTTLRRHALRLMLLAVVAGLLALLVAANVLYDLGTPHGKGQRSPVEELFVPDNRVYP
jgi:hypothetical protein